MSEEESEIKRVYKLQLPTETRSNFFLLRKGEKLHLKVPLGEVENVSDH
jgi:hypothetical protein